MNIFEEKGIERLFRKRILVLSGDITPKKSDELVLKFLNLASHSNKEIKLIINTDGGDFIEAIHLFDFLKIIKPNIIGIVVGNCHSSGVILLQACSKRLATPNSHFLVHSLSLNFKISTSRELDDLRNNFEEKLLDGFLHQKIMCEILKKRMKLPEEQIKHLLKRGDSNIAITATWAKKYNLIDEIVPNFKVDLAK